MKSPGPLRAFLVDDEPLALKRLARLLKTAQGVEVAGSTSDPEEAVAFLERGAVDVLFLDIQMPGMNGFELLQRLSAQPMVVFTTAYDEYALRAFEVNSIDYLLKPVERPQLERALAKLSRLRSVSGPGELRQEWVSREDFRRVLEQMAASLQESKPEFMERVASRVGERVQLLEVARVTHFFARDKLTYAVIKGKEHCVDPSLADLESRLDPRKFVRIHRSTLVNLDFVREIDAWFGGGALVRLKDEARTELKVARDRVTGLKQQLGL